MTPAPTVHQAASSIPRQRTASAFGNVYQFTGRRFDDQAGLYYNRHRYYEPVSGRFIGRDPYGPWEDPVSLGTAYAYVGNKPPNYTDRLGLRGRIADDIAVTASETTKKKLPGKWGYFRWLMEVALCCSCKGRTLEIKRIAAKGRRVILKKGSKEYEKSKEVDYATVLTHEKKHEANSQAFYDTLKGKIQRDVAGYNRSQNPLKRPCLSRAKEILRSAIKDMTDWYCTEHFHSAEKGHGWKKEEYAGTVGAHKAAIDCKRKNYETLYKKLITVKKGCARSVFI